MKKLLLFSSALLCSFLSFSQDQFNYEAELSRMIEMPKSPEAQAFEKYGAIPVNLRVGAPNVSIPLYTYKGKEFDLPMSLTYNINARKVEDIASGAGLGWNLNLGGAVTRNANNHPDSALVYSGSFTSLFTSTSLKEKYYKYKDRFVNTTSELFVDRPEAEEYFRFMDKVQAGAYEVAMDNYSIHAPGLSDNVSMVFDDSDPNNLRVRPVPMINPRLKMVSYDDVAWSVYDDKGTFYLFTYIEETDTSNNLDTNTINGAVQGPTHMVYTSAWRLTQIISPNGKDVYDFEYQSYALWDVPEQVWIAKKIDVPPVWPNTQWFEDETEATGDYKRTEQALKKVKHNGRVIIEIDLLSRDDFVNASRIGSITVKNPLNGAIVNHFKFNHTYFGTQTNEPIEELRLKLDEIEIAGNGFDPINPVFDKKYTFNYETPALMPARTSLSIDEFGFYNGKSNGLTVLYPEWIDALPGTTLSGADRSFDFNKAKIGILNKITYPTGGYSEFVYEPHMEEGGDINNTNDHLPGIRIASITGFTDANQEATKKVYEYKDLAMDPYSKPVLKYKVVAPYFESGVIQTDRFGFHRMTRAISGNQPYITYDRVIENNVDPNTNVSLVSATHEFYDLNYITGAIIGQLEPPFALSYYTGVQSGELKKRTSTTSIAENTYQTTALIPDKGYSLRDNPENAKRYVLYTQESGGVRASFLLGLNGFPLGTCGQGNNIGCETESSLARLKPFFTTISPQYMLSKQHIASEKLNGNQVTTTTTTNYLQSIDYLPRETITTTSEDKTLIARYSYPKDYPNDPLMVKMVTANRLNVPVQVQKFKKVGSTEELLSTQKTKFEERQVEIITNLPVILPEFIQFEKGGTGTNLEDRLEVKDYDNLGNITEILQPGGSPISYIWGYGGKFPVAKIDNATYAEATAVGLGLNWILINDPDANGGQSALRGEIDKIRAGVPKAMVTTYTYNSLIGVSSITDPLGVIMYYHYDDQNRLKYVEDKDNKVLSKQEYNYRTN